MAFPYFNLTDKWSIACAQICLVLWLCLFAMVTFKDVRIKDVRLESTRNLLFQHPSMESKGNQDLHSLVWSVVQLKMRYLTSMKSRFRIVKGLKVCS